MPGVEIGKDSNRPIGRTTAIEEDEMMDTRHSRRALARQVGAVSVGTSLLFGSLRAAVAQDGFASGGIGLSRTEWEATYGAGTPLQKLVQYENARSRVPGSPIYVGFNNDYVAHIELRWQATQLGGLREQDARAEVKDLLPADADLQDVYYMPPTPDGPVALRAWQWESPSLAEVTVARTAILVVYQETEREQNPGSAPVTIIPAATITIALPRQ